MIEVLVVILIIAFLAALLIPAVQAAIRAAKNAQVSAEINNLAQAMASFKNKYGDYPPSRVLLSEGGFIPNNNAPGASGMGPGTPVQSGGPPGATSYTDVPYPTLSARTAAAFRKFWPRVALSAGGAAPATGWYDFNGNGKLDATSKSGAGGTYDSTPYVLQGHECLVFFLGGIPQQVLDSSGNSVGYAMTGFDTNPVNPFTNNLNNGNAAYGPNRTPPLYDFVPSRCQVMTAYQSTPPIYRSPPKPSAGNGFPGYLDALASQSSPANNFYAYFSTNNGQGYDPDDVNFQNSQYDVDASGVNPLVLNYNVPLVQGGINASPSPNPYTTSATYVPYSGTGAYTPPIVTYQNAQSFQIISPGLDGAYGLGGLYSPNSPNAPLPFDTTTNVSNTSDTGVRSLERDNLTNFHNGRLE
jgi:general secretion pathway protein G